MGTIDVFGKKINVDKQTYIKRIDGQTIELEYRGKTASLFKPINVFQSLNVGSDKFIEEFTKQIIINEK